MKKLIALMLAGVICATAAYTALAVDGEEETESNPAPISEEEQKTPSEILQEIANDPEAKEIADKFVDATKKGASTEDINATLLALADYINSKGYDVGQIKNGSKTKDFVGDFLEDCGVDSDELFKAIEKIDEVNNDVFGDKESKGNPSSNLGTDVDLGGSPEYYGVDSTTIPDTGFMD